MCKQQVLVKIEYTNNRKNHTIFYFVSSFNKKNYAENKSLIKLNAHLLEGKAGVQNEVVQLLSKILRFPLRAMQYHILFL